MGVDPSALPRAAAQLRDFGTVERDLAPLDVLVVNAPRARGMRRIDGVRWVERLGAHRRLAFTPTDPLATKQWYLQQIHAFDFWPDAPVLPPVKVAVIDSGIDSTHPDLASRIVRRADLCRRIDRRLAGARDVRRG